MREILYRGLSKNRWVYGLPYYSPGNGTWKIVHSNGWVPTYSNPDEGESNVFIDVDPNTIGLCSPFLDKKKNRIFDGDRILIRVPYRSTQTHTGDNIPNGSYTEPLEPEIDEFEATVEFKDGAFIVTDFESHVWHESDEILLKWVYNTEYSEEEIKESIRIKSRNTDSFDFWDDPKDNSGDLQYLLSVYEPNNLFELIEYLRGVEVIGNIHQNEINGNS